MDDDSTHIVTFTISGKYPNGPKNRTSITMSSDGSLDRLMEVFRTVLVSEGYALETAATLRIDS